MAICKMLEMKLVGTECDEAALMNALHKTGAVELKPVGDVFSCEKRKPDERELTDKISRVESAVNVISRYASKNGQKSEGDGFGVSYDDFMNISEREGELLSFVDKAAELHEKANLTEAHITALKGEIKSYEAYVGIGRKFSDFKNTAKTCCRLGLCDANGLRKLKEEAEKNQLIAVFEEGGSDRQKVVSVINHVSVEKEVPSVLAACGFTVCTFKDEMTAEEKIEKIEGEIFRASNDAEELSERIAELATVVKDLKILSDYYLFAKEKAEASGDFARTASTFVLSAYVPEDKKDDVLEAVKGVTRTAYAEFREIGEDEFAPTLMKNRKVPRQFEVVTNLYSVPKYLSFDPNAVLGFFFSIFMGFINADVGYGVIMFVGGLLFANSQKREGSIARLARVMAYSGVFTVIFGLLVDSLFGVPFMRAFGWIENPIMPDPIKVNSTMAGISVPTMLLISLGMGVIHIMVGLFITALVHFQHGRVLDGICDGLVWDIFLLGLIVLVMGMIGTIPEPSGTVGAAMIIAAVAVGALTAGRHEKGFGKFSKGFGAVYGLINYLSDILSYARLYGLMLSGAQIASIISNSLALPMLESPGGVGGWIACGLIMLIGHAFNMAMGLLGAFVHDARLQYVEFFSRFYRGDGELFTPMCSKFAHIYLDK